MMKFTKMHGAGNDYIYVDCFAETVPDNLPQLARDMSDRRFGVGGDGLILIRPSDVADARMQMFNVDGSEAQMCGNGIRCVAKYVYDHGICQKDQLQIETLCGVLPITVQTQNAKVQCVEVDMGEPILQAERIPTELGGDRVINQSLVVDGREFTVTSVSLGNPHCVIFVPEITDELVLGMGPKIEVHRAFPERVNVEFVEVISRDEVRQRTWERGSGETWACGTGASAVCVAGVLAQQTNRRILNHLRGGDLQLEWQESDNHVRMTGPAVEVFSGTWQGNGQDCT